MDYKVVITADAEEDLNKFLQYLLFVKHNPQAAANLLDDFELTKRYLSLAADSLESCDNPELREQNYKRMNFLSYRYFMLYRTEGTLAIVDNIFHVLQDYENKMI